MRMVAFAGLLLLSVLPALGLPVSVSEGRLIVLPPGVDPAAVAIAADASQIAYPLEDGGKVSVVLDGKVGEQYDKVEGLRFVEGGRLLSYVGSLAGRFYFVCADRRSGPWDEVKLPAFWNGPAPNPAAFIGRSGATSSLVVDGAEGPRFEEIATVAVSTDGSSLAYVGRTGGIYSVIWNAKRYDYPSKVDSLSLARFGDDLHIAWILHEKGRESLVVDGVRGRGYEAIGSCVAFDSIGAAKPLYAYEARTGDTWRYVVGDTETPAFDQVMLESLVLASDGRILAYATPSKDGWYLRRGGALDGPYMDMYCAYLLPDGKSLILFAVDATGNSVVVVDGREKARYDNNGQFYFLTDFHAPDKWAVAGKKTGQWYIFSDAGTSQAYDDIHQIAYGSDGIIHVVSGKGGSLFVDSGADRSGPYENAEFLWIGGSSPYLGFGGTTAAVMVRKQGKYSILIGSQSTADYDRIRFYEGDAEAAFTFFGFRGQEVWKGIVARK